MDKVRVIKRSLRCFVVGWLGLIPLLGIASAFISIRLYRQVKAEANQEWNPARRYARCGYVLAWTGGGPSFLLFSAALGIALWHLLI